ncbi:MAG: TRAP transporter small permease [Lautropia sp.]
MPRLTRWTLLLDRGVGWLSAAAAALACTAIVLIALGITVNAVSRYALNRPILFVDEYAQYLLVVAFYLGVGYTLRAGRHVSVQMLVDRLGVGVRRLLRIAVSVVGLWAIALMCQHSWGAFVSTTRSGIVSLTPLETPLSLPFLSVAVGMTLFVLEIVVGILKDLVGIERVVDAGVDPGVH